MNFQKFLIDQGKNRKMSQGKSQGMESINFFEKDN
jgi:hypothetical protein